MVMLYLLTRLASYFLDLCSSIFCLALLWAKTQEERSDGRKENKKFCFQQWQHNKQDLSFSLFLLFCILFSPERSFVKCWHRQKCGQQDFLCGLWAECFFVCLYLSCICMRKRDSEPSSIILRFDWHEKSINTFGNVVLWSRGGGQKKIKRRKGNIWSFLLLRIESIRNGKNLFLKNKTKDV